jgi:hypothetical protein
MDEQEPRITKHTHLCVQTYIHSSTHTRTHTYTHTYTHTHTHTHTHINTHNALVKGKHLRPDDGRAGAQSHHVLDDGLALSLHRNHAGDLDHWVHRRVRKVALCGSIK